MCISATVLAAASLATAAVGTAIQIDATNAQTDAQNAMARLQQQQMESQAQAQRLQALEAEAARLEDFRRQRAANLAALASMGLSENRSFLDGIEPSNERALQFDLRNLRLGMLGQESRLADEIRVNRAGVSMNNANRSASNFGSMISLAGSAIGAAQFNSMYGTPGGGRTGTTMNSGNGRGAFDSMGTIARAPIRGYNGGFGGGNR